jgi:sulfite oxidase
MSIDSPRWRAILEVHLLTVAYLSFLTTKGAYDRNHGPIPHLDADTHLLSINGEVNNPITLTISQLRNDFPQHEVISALQCAGNRRHTMRTLLKEVKGLDWCDGAVMNCSWKGPRLRDVLLAAGVRGSKKQQHVAFSCYQTLCQEDHFYGGSIELERAMRPEDEIILALEVSNMST